ncbi:MAG: SRPBCC family protein, partial [Chloroflexota bacterium]
MKNSVSEKLGLRGYALLTDQCVVAARLNPEALGLVRHAETFESVGEVGAWVHDLDARWEHERASRRVRVTEANALARIAIEVPAEPAVIWAFVTDPANRVRYVPGIVSVDEQSAGGRRGIGTTNHCVHGAGAGLEEVLDW